MKEIFLTVGLFFIFLFIIFNITIYLKKRKESFDMLDIITSEMTSNQNYQKCLDQNQFINSQSKGKYQNCKHAVDNISRWGMGSESNIGYGQMGTICPVSCLLSTPSKCLENTVSEQEELLNKIKKQENEYRVNSFENLNQITNNLNNHSQHIDELYQKEYVQDFLRYQNDSVDSISDPIYNKIIKEKINKVSNDINNPNDVITPHPTLILDYNN